MDTDELLVPVERIERCILFIRGQKVMLDSDLAELYDVSTKRLNEQVKRNMPRFPEDFMFRLSDEELSSLRCQTGASEGPGGRRYLPYAFTEQGVAMLSGVLHSPRAIRANVEIMRAFVRLRRMIASHEELARRLDELEEKYDGQFKVVFEAIRQLMLPPPVKHRPVGFRMQDEDEPAPVG